MYSIRRWLCVVLMPLTIGPAMVQANHSSSYNADAVHLETFDTGYLYSSGGEFSETFSEYIGEGFQVVDVRLRSWRFDYQYSDHHLRRVSLRIDNVSYNPSSGYITFTVKGAFHDKNRDDDYQWRVVCTILAFGPGQTGATYNTLPPFPLPAVPPLSSLSP